jgi:hypothetical protein
LLHAACPFLVGGLIPSRPKQTLCLFKNYIYIVAEFYF